jgi:hypothetical protein
MKLKIGFISRVFTISLVYSQHTHTHTHTREGHSPLRSKFLSIPLKHYTKAQSVLFLPPDYNQTSPSVPVSVPNRQDKNQQDGTYNEN